MKLSHRGPKGMVAKMAGAAKVGTPTAIGTLYQQAEKIMTASKQTYVPVDDGILRDSGFVEPPVETPAGVVRFGGESVLTFNASVTLGFGGPAAPYAVIQHEDLTLRHRVGQAKYLEIPFRAAMQGMKAVLEMRQRDAIRQAFQRLGKVEANVRAGRDVSWGMPLFRGGE